MNQGMKRTRPDHHTAPSGSRFPTTRHSLIVRARSEDGDIRLRARDSLIGCYWKPVYKYLRLRWNQPREDAEDLTQSFFGETLDASFFQRYDASRGRFRTYLRVCVDGFAANRHKWALRHKRGGGVAHIPLDFTSAEGEVQERPLANGRDPEDVFREEWIRRMFELALEDVRETCRQEAKPIHFALFERYHLGPDDPSARETYAGLAREYQIPETQVTNYLAWARRHFRDALLARVREITASDDEYRAEVRDLLGGDP